MLEKNVEFSIDKLTVLGEFISNRLISNFIMMLEDVPFCFRKYIDTSFYSRSYLINDLGFLQFDTATGKFRIEFNPNKLNDYTKNLLSIILSYIKNFHFTRIDLAIDLYNYEFSNYNVVDLISRKKAYYYDRVGRLETAYFGSRSSNKYIRVYNKAVEQKMEGGCDWWRIELQLRDTYIDTYLDGLKDLLDGLLIFKYVSISSLNYKDKAILEYILKDSSRFNEIPKKNRLKYKKILDNLRLESLSFVNDLMLSANEYVYSFMNSLCPNFDNRI